jgi:hypothetical protein
MLASGTQVRGFEPGRSGRISQGEKILSMPSFGGEIKPSVPCCRFASLKRSLQMAWNPPFVGKITGHLSPIVPPFPARGLSHRHRHGGTWQCKWELLPKLGWYNKPTQLRYIQWRQPPGPKKEEEEMVGARCRLFGPWHFIGSFSHFLVVCSSKLCG